MQCPIKNANTRGEIKGCAVQPLPTIYNFGVLRVDLISIDEQFAVTG